MERDTAVQGLLDAWREQPVDLAAHGVRDQEQLQSVQRALRGVARARQERVRRQRIFAGLAVAAGVLAVATGGWWIGRQGGAVVAQVSGVELQRAEGDVRVHDASGRVLASGDPLPFGATVEARSGSFELTFPSGAHAQGGSATRMSVGEAGSQRRESLLLARGSVEVEVPRLTQPIEFAVDTPDARVVVHGTRFRVQVDPSAPPGASTQVAVTHGIVSVQAGSKEVWLRAGERWPAVLAPAVPADAAAPEAPAVDPLAPELQQEPVDSDESVASQGKRPAPRSRLQRRVDPSLAQENRAFAAAMARRNVGELSQALSALERWLVRYPDSVLQQEARVEQFRLLDRLGRSREAARAARSYLGDYRDGYAREEARDLVLGSP
jgi:hypothetical protein